MDHIDLTPGGNNVWYEYNDSDDVIVFVHGFFSESKGTWLYKDKSAPLKELFWPDLIRRDENLGNPSLFLGGYDTAIDSGDYGFASCSEELFRAIQRPNVDGQEHPPVTSKGGIVFVCHSMGGIIVRYMLERHWPAFQDKRVGLVLIASPSFGSRHADRLKWLAKLYNHQQGLQLRWGDALLKDLDSRFKDLVNDRIIPHLVGTEAVESRFILRWKWLPFFKRTLVVTEESAGRYFGTARMLRGTDHFSVVRPDGPRHSAHELLLDFWPRYACLKTQASPPRSLIGPVDGLGTTRGDTSPGIPNNLPKNLPCIIGRNKERAETRTLFTKSRLLTLTGSGGSGKTRLALEVATDLLDSVVVGGAGEFADGVWLVELASLADPDLVLRSVVNLLGVNEEAGKTPLERLVDWLRQRRLLLVLDNCEHLIDACATLATSIRRNCRGVRVLATSRQPLRAVGERAHPVHPLPFPDAQQAQTVESLSQFPSIALFTERANNAVPTFAVTTENADAVSLICRRLDGIPLAIELAAVWVRELPVAKIAAGLDDRFDILTRGPRTAEPRQQTLRAAIDSSYYLLDKNERAVFRRLSVFAGGWTLEAAEVVCAGGNVRSCDVLRLLISLSEKSLIESGSEEKVRRYRMLETVREYAREKLEHAPGKVAIRDLHLQWCLQTAIEADEQSSGANKASGISSLEADYDNLLAALVWSQQKSLEEDLGLELAVAMGKFWDSRGFNTEGRLWLATFLARSNRAEPCELRAKALTCMGVLASNQGDYPSATDCYVQAIAILRSLEKEQELANCLIYIGDIFSNQGNHSEAQKQYKKSIVILRRLGRKGRVANCLIRLGNSLSSQGDYASAAKCYAQALPTLRSLGEDQGLANCLNFLGRIHSAHNNYNLAQEQINEGLLVFRQLNHKGGIANCLTDLGTVAFLQGNQEVARSFYEQGLMIRRELRDQDGIALLLTKLGHVVYQQKQLDKAKEYYTESITIWLILSNQNRTHSNHIRLVNWRVQGNLTARQGFRETLLGLANIALSLNQDVKAAQLYGAWVAVKPPHNSVPISGQIHFEQSLLKLNEKLYQDHFSVAFSKGQMMTLDEAMEIAVN